MHLVFVRMQISQGPDISLIQQRWLDLPAHALAESVVGDLPRQDAVGIAQSRDV